MDDSTRDEYWTLLSWVGLHTQGLGELLRDARSPAVLLSQPGLTTDTCFSSLPGATQRALHRARRHWPRRNREFRRAQGPDDARALFLPLGDERYPAALRAIPDPPPWLFCRGDPHCLAAPGIAIVGSRRASHAGLRAAQLIAERLARAGYLICSGLALGIDAAAHRGALSAGRTVAVLASGIDRASPVRHQSLAESIVASGCLVTELPPGTAPTRAQFPRRNRIISGLSQATIIVEAALPSGSLHTAAAALEQGRDVYTLPWSVFHDGGAGCRVLLRDGATPITDIDELDDWFPGVSPAPPQVTAAAPKGAAARLLALVGDGGLPIETLLEHTGYALPQLLALLGELEVGGWLRQKDGLYCRDDCKPCQS